MAAVKVWLMSLWQSVYHIMQLAMIQGVEDFVMTRKHSKRLEMLVGMALSAGLVLGIYPAEAFAQDFRVSYNGSQYIFTDTSNSQQLAICNQDGFASTWDTQLETLLSNGYVSICIDIDSDDNKMAFENVFANGINIKKGIIAICDSDPTTVKFTVSADNDAVGNVAYSDGTLYCRGNIATVDIQPAIGSDMNTIDLTGADTNISVVDFSSNTSSAPTKNFMINADGKIIDNLYVEETFSVTTADNSSVTVNRLNIRGGSVAAGTGATLTVTNTFQTRMEGNITVSGVTFLADAYVMGMRGQKFVGSNLTFNNLYIMGAELSNTDNGNITINGSLSLEGMSENGTISIGTGKLTLNNADATYSFNSDASITAGTIESKGSISINGATINATNLITKGLTIAGSQDLSFSNVTLTGGTFSTGSGSVATSGTFTLGKDVTINDQVNVTANNLVLDARDDNLTDKLGKLNLTRTGSVNVKLIHADKVDEARLNGLSEAIKSSIGANTSIKYVSGSGEAMSAEEQVNEAEEQAEQALESVSKWAKADAAQVAELNPFQSALPSAEDINAIRNPSAAQRQAISEARDALVQARSAVAADNSLSDERRSQLLAELDGKLELMDVQRQADRLVAAVQQAGKTAAAPAVASARAATAITNVLTNNVVNRTAEIRGFASAIDDDRPAPEKLWFQYKHTQMDVTGGDVYSKSVVNTNNFQLGYDTKIGADDYLGAYIGTTVGNADFTSPKQNGRLDIENAFDFGIYGTHILPHDQYIDYLVHTDRFDSKFGSTSYGTDDMGIMIGYGVKLAQTDRLTLNPYVQLAYDKISVDSYYAGPNFIKSDDSHNWTAKLGLNLIDASGLYGGIAYSRGLAGSYNAYINGVPMPGNDNNANVLYFNLGYRADMAKNMVLDLSMEKTLLDYKGWTATGRVNYYF